MERFLIILFFTAALCTVWVSCTNDDPLTEQETKQPVLSETDGPQEDENRKDTDAEGTMEDSGEHNVADDPDGSGDRKDPEGENNKDSTPFSTIRK